MTEEEYIVNTFNNNFSQFKNKNVVLYGISKNTKIILEKCPEYNIVGLLDGYQTEGQIYDKNILSMNEMKQLEVEIIIIVARISSAKIIYRRIANYCKENNILVFDINGLNFEDNTKKISNIHDYFNKNERFLFNEIDKHSIVSFDIFDTLIMRKTLYPTDVFELVSQKIDKKLSVKFDFVKERIFAEKQILIQNPTFDLIYNNLQKNVNITNTEKEYLKKLEFELERSVISPRKKMIEFLNYSKDIGKDVYLVSDMYYTKGKLEELLITNGIQGYKELLISCEHGNTKSENLFKKLKGYIGEQSCIHIGDNYEADIISAKRNNITPFEILSAVDMLEISSYKELLDDTSSLGNRCLLGLFVEKAFNNPFCLYNSEGRLRVTDAYTMGYLFIAPLISEFTKWLIKELQINDFDKILFLSRDGYLVQKLYEIAKICINDLPDSQYFLTSRIIGIAATIYDENNILETSRLAYNGTKEELLKNRYLLEESDIDVNVDKQKSIEEYVLSHSEQILKKSKVLRDAYNKYAKQLGVNSEDKIAVFDFYAAGTCQLCLEKILKNQFSGYYFYQIKSTEKEKNNLNVNSFFDFENIFNNDVFFSEGYLFLENILTSMDPTLKEINKFDEIKYVNESRKKEQLIELIEIHQGIEEYFKQYLDFMWKFDLQLCEVDKLFSLMINKYTEFENIVILNNTARDDFFNRTYDFKNFN